LIAGGRKYLAANGEKVPEAEFMKGVDEIWTNVNTNGDKYITSMELGNAVFGLVDQNGDGTLEP